MNTCPECGGNFEPGRGGRAPGPRRFCSDRCRHAWNHHNPRHLLTCQHCGQEFRRPAKQKFCSHECRNEANRVPGGYKRPVRECEWCGTDFRPGCGVGPDHPSYQRACGRLCRLALNSTSNHCALSFCKGCGANMPRRRGNYEYCSADCRPAPYVSRVGKPVKRTCRDCGTVGVIENRQGPWVCDDCKKENRRASTYKGIKKFLRDAVLERDNWRCQLCGGVIPRGQTDTCADTYPEIDHIIPRSLGGLTTFDNLQASHRICNNRKGATYAERPTAKAA